MRERQHPPAFALRAIGRELVVVLEQAGEGAEVDQRARIGLGPRRVEMRASIVGNHEWIARGRRCRQAWIMPAGPTLGLACFLLTTWKPG